MKRALVVISLTVLLLLAVSLASFQLSAGESRGQGISGMTGEDYVLNLRPEDGGDIPAGESQPLMSGGSYHLLAPAVDSGSGCCCKCYLPVLHQP